MIITDSSIWYTWSNIFWLWNSGGVDEEEVTNTVYLHPVSLKIDHDISKKRRGYRTAEDWGLSQTPWRDYGSQKFQFFTSWQIHRALWTFMPENYPCTCFQARLSSKHTSPNLHLSEWPWILHVSGWSSFKVS